MGPDWSPPPDPAVRGEVAGPKPETAKVVSCREALVELKKKIKNPGFLAAAKGVAGEGGQEGCW